MTEPDKEDAAINLDGGRSQTGTVAESWPEDEAAEEKLRRLITEYETRIDEVAEVVARVRHEINNPLTGVLGQAQLLLREELNEKTRKRVQTIEELAIRLRDIVGQLRQVQKISRS
jgi:signal transduction histidine kinase